MKAMNAIERGNPLSIREKKYLSELNWEFQFAKSLIKEDKTVFGEHDLDFSLERIKPYSRAAYRARLEKQWEIIRQISASFSNVLLARAICKTHSDAPLFSFNLTSMGILPVHSAEGAHVITQVRMHTTDVLIAGILEKLKNLEPATQCHLYNFMETVKNLHQEAGRSFDLGAYKILVTIDLNIENNKFQIDNFRRDILQGIYPKQGYKASSMLIYDPKLENTWENLLEKAQTLDRLLQSDIQVDLVRLPGGQDFDKLFFLLPAEIESNEAQLSQETKMAFN